jgi:hypothetical protein
MNPDHLLTPRRPLDRRTFLRGAGALLALPALECLTPVRADRLPAPRRMLVIVNNIGLFARHFFPAEVGRDYRLSPYLTPLAGFREDFTVCSGLSHPGVTGGHSTDNSFLTSARGAFKANFRNTISLDQYAAEHLGHLTRFPSFNLGVNIEKGNRSLSWTRDGVLLPAEDDAAALFRRMFVQGDATAVAAQLRRLEERGSILDTLLAESKRLATRVGVADRRRLDQYLTAVREVEGRLQTTREWEQRPRPVTTRSAPEPITENRYFFEKFELMLRMAQLAFESDSTRLVTLMLDAFQTPVFRLGGEKLTTEGYHGLSHHGQDEQKVGQLEVADRQNMAILAGLLRDLAAVREGGERLLDRTMVLFGSNMGDANIHDNTNLPIIIAGGGFRHGQHLGFKRHQNTPLSNLFVSMLQRLGIETDSFGSSTGRLTGLEPA